MKTLPVRWPFLLALGVTACATVLTSIGRVPEVDEIRFSHAKHQQAKIECISCHETIFDAATLTGSFLPDEAKCMECHKAKKAEGNCQMCHSEVKLAAAWPKREPKLNFNHIKHIELVKEDCSKCHTRLPEPMVQVPISDGHAACMTCHEHAEAQADARCSTCHLDLKKFGLKPVADFSHQGDFLKRHGMAARAEGASCATCHEQSTCLDCHARTSMTGLNVVLPDRPDRSFIHRNDFVSRHPIEAAADPASCRRCHAVSSCEQCHAAQHVTPQANARTPHPAGWALPGSAAFHGDAARQNISSCASCHDQGAQSNCVTCHKVGGIGGSLHPPSFRVRHSLQETATNPMCRACHL